MDEAAHWGYVHFLAPCSPLVLPNLPFPKEFLDETGALTIFVGYKTAESQEKTIWRIWWIWCPSLEAGNSSLNQRNSI